MLAVYIALLILTDHFIAHTQALFESHVSVSPFGHTFSPKQSIETPLATIHVASLIKCTKQCNQNQLCRTFVYEKNSSVCQLYRSDSQGGNITATNLATSVVGQIRYTPQLYASFNRTCSQCEMSRYLTCRNGTCHCPSPGTYWDGQMCQNQFYYGEACNQSVWCRNDLNLTCVFGSCQSSTAMCKLGATPITFDDISNAYTNEGIIPSSYKGFNWADGKYLNASAFHGSGYDKTISSGEFVSWFNSLMTLQLIAANQNFTLNSCIMSAGWSDDVSVTIAGYASSTQLYSTTLSLNTYTKVTPIFNWSGLTRVLFNPHGTGYIDTGMDNLCITY